MGFWYKFGFDHSQKYETNKPSDLFLTRDNYMKLETSYCRQILEEPVFRMDLILNLFSACHSEI
jgi:hypothetical protein